MTGHIEAKPRRTLDERQPVIRDLPSAAGAMITESRSHTQIAAGLEQLGILTRVTFRNRGGGHSTNYDGIQRMSARSWAAGAPLKGGAGCVPVP